MDLRKVQRARVRKLIDKLQKSKKWNQEHFIYCTVGMGVPLVTRKKLDSQRYTSWEVLVDRFYRYFGIPRHVAEDIIGMTNHVSVLRKLEKWT